MPLGKHAFQNAHWLSSCPREASSLPQGEGGQSSMQLLLLPASPSSACWLRLSSVCSLLLSAWGLMTSCSAGLLFTPPHPSSLCPGPITALSTHQAAPASRLSRSTEAARLLLADRTRTPTSVSRVQNIRPCAPLSKHLCYPMAGHLVGAMWSRDLGLCVNLEGPWGLHGTQLVWIWGLSTHRLV